VSYDERRIALSAHRNETVSKLFCFNFNVRTRLDAVQMLQRQTCQSNTVHIHKSTASTHINICMRLPSAVADPESL